MFGLGGLFCCLWCCYFDLTTVVFLLFFFGFTFCLVLLLVGFVWDCGICSVFMSVVFALF